jgi:magnesium-transporting ATPase (P-type)
MDTGTIKLFCKGADTVIFERLKPGQSIKDVTLEHLGELAAEGLRTLCIASTVLDKEEYQQWNKQYHAASITLQNREKEASSLLQLQNIRYSFCPNLDGKGCRVNRKGSYIIRSNGYRR